MAHEMHTPEIEKANKMLAKLVEDVKALKAHADKYDLNIEVYGFDYEPILDGLRGNVTISIESWLPSDMDC
jgi:hypothetical protein